MKEYKLCVFIPIKFNSIIFLADKMYVKVRNDDSHGLELINSSPVLGLLNE